MRRRLLPVALLAAACAHGEPFEPDPPDSRGPLTEVVPRRLTYNPGDDRSPTLAGAEVLYSRYDPRRGTAARCIAALPAEGGTLRAVWCPPAPTPADTFVSTWLEPTLSDDGSRVAFVWQRGAETSALAAWSHHLVVARTDSITSPQVAVLLAGQLPGDRRYNTALELSWAGDGRVRFLAAFDSIFKVKGGGASRFTDTVLVAGALMELDVGAGTLGVVPGGDSVSAYTAAPGGGLWVVVADSLWLLDETGTRTPLAEVGGQVSDLATVDGRALLARWTTEPLLWWEPVTGASRIVLPAGPTHRITAAGGRRFIAEMEADERAFGAPANLWLLELPPFAPPP